MWKKFQDWGGSASEALQDLGVALCVFLAAVYGLLVKSLVLLVWAAAALGEILVQKWEAVNASTQRVTADLTELCLSWCEDMMEFIEVVIDATAVLLQNSISPLADLGHSTATHLVPVMVEFRNYLDQRLDLGERYQNLIRDSAGTPVQHWRDGIERLANNAQLLVEKLSTVNHKVLFSVYCAFVFIVWSVLFISENEGIVSGFVFGLINGLGLMRFWAWMITRRIKRREDTISFASALYDTRFREQMKATESGGDDKPPIPLFEGFEKVEWLNKLVRKVWPFLTTLIEDNRPLVRDSLEAFTENYRLGLFQVIGEDEDEQQVRRYIPAGETLTGLYLNDLNLGSAAPRIGGVKLRSMKDNKMVMDVRLQWESKALAVTLGLGTSDGNLKVLLEDLHIKATIRVHLYFVETPPFVSLLVLFIPRKPMPTIQYRLTPDPDALEHLQPIVMPQLEEFIYRSVNDSLHWPNRLVITPTWAAKPTVDVNDLRLKPHGQLHVTILKGENLVNLYAYVLLYIRVKFKVRTKSVENTPNAFWLEEFYLDAEDQESQILTLQLMNESKGKDEVVGTVTYPLAKLDPDKDFELELPVPTPDGDTSRRDVGLLMIILRYHVYTKEEQDAAMVAERKLDEALAAPRAPGSYATAVQLLHG
ncbi:hypothetical protein R1flu_010036 [Riccia fluitans]|uniref:C2 domain-containing protein n=1 Tax=Riccia fluitans TaxID=41844 RepID=A0ABD1Z3V6_9MARC